MAHLDYICEKQQIQDEKGESHTSYRFHVLDSRGAALISVDDICRSEHQAHALEDIFRRNQVALVHVMDVLEDWLP